MTRTVAGIAALCALALALAGVLAAEWREPASLDAPAPGLAPLPRAAAGALLGAPDAAGQAATALARPLFSPSRRPVEDGGAAATGLPRLAGVLVSGAGRAALFAGGEGRRGVAVAEGGSLGAFTVRAISPGQVVVDGPSGTQVLRPSFEGSGGGRGGAAVPVLPPTARPLVPPVAELLRNPPSYPPTAGLLPLTGPGAQSVPPSTQGGAPILQQFQEAPFRGIGVPGMPDPPASSAAPLPGVPLSAPFGPRP